MGRRDHPSLRCFQSWASSSNKTKIVGLSSPSHPSIEPRACHALKMAPPTYYLGSWDPLGKNIALQTSKDSGLNLLGWIALVAPRVQTRGSDSFPLKPFFTGLPDKTRPECCESNFAWDPKWWTS